MSIKVEKLNYIYSEGTAYEKHALTDISFDIPDGEFVGIIGHTGSGKSTLIQHLNGLIKATSGHIYINGEDIYQDKFNFKKLREKVGIVFQYPEHQLFEESVIKDVCYGPKNQGLNKEECFKRAHMALELTGLDEKYFERSPFELSGGQKRRVAIAGVLAMEPEILILDEPTAGLDPKGRDDILSQINHLHKEKKITVILVSHSMEDIAKFADRIIVMNKGSLLYNDIPKHVFSHYKELESVGLSAPQVTYIIHDLIEAGFDINPEVTTVKEAAAEIMEALKDKRNDS
ncbi:MAG: energy-coupling factor transporter ATPase [Suipraeoptans sp.]